MFKKGDFIRNGKSNVVYRFIAMDVFEHGFQDNIISLYRLDKQHVIHIPQMNFISSPCHLVTPEENEILTLLFA